MVEQRQFFVQLRILALELFRFLEKVFGDHGEKLGWIRGPVLVE